MPIDDSQIYQYQSAAVEMCYRMNVSPYEHADALDPGSPPRWVYYARRMAEHEMMVQVMRQFGRPV